MPSLFWPKYLHPLYHFAPWTKVDPISTSTPRVPVTRGRPPWVVTTWPGTKPQVEVIIAAALSFHLGWPAVGWIVGWIGQLRAPASVCVFFGGGLVDRSSSHTKNGNARKKSQQASPLICEKKNLNHLNLANVDVDLPNTIFQKPPF